MKFKAKSLKWFAGRPVAILNSNTARSLGLHVDDRAKIKTAKGKIIVIIDAIVGGFLKKNEAALSEEIIQKLGVKAGQSVEIDPAPARQSVHYIYEKLTGMSLERKKIGDGRCGKISGFLIKKYRSLLR